MTLAQLQTALQAKGYGTDTAAQQIEALNSVYRRVCGYRRWDWLETRATVATVVGTATVALPTSFIHMDAVRIEQGTDRWNLDYRPAQEFRDAEHTDRDNGRPRWWTVIDRLVHLWPTPDRIYTVTFDYLIDPADLSAAGDIPVIPLTYQDILVEGAAAFIAGRERDWNAYNTYKAEYNERLKEMTGELNLRQRQSAQFVQRSRFWDQIGRGSGGPPYGGL